MEKKGDVMNETLVRSTAVVENKETPSLATFADMKKSENAPQWIHEGVCNTWDLDPATTKVTLITVSENITFLVENEGGTFGVVRVSQPGYVGGPNAIESELAWLTSLHALEGVSLVEAIPTIAGNGTGTIVDDDGVGWSVICTSFVDGTVLEDMEDPSSYYHVIGRFAAQFHRHAREWELPEGFERFNWELSDMIGPMPRWGRWEDIDLTTEEFLLLKQAEEKAIKIMSRVEKNCYNTGIIHADLRPSNIIMTQEGELTIIDFDDSGFSLFLYDYAAALSFVEHEPYAPKMAQEWIAGYQEITPLADDEIEYASALSMIRRLQMLGWTVNHFPDALPGNLFAEQLPGTVLCAQRYLDNTRWLLES